MRGKTNTGSEIAFKTEPSSTTAVNLGGNSEIKPTGNTLFDFYRINVAHPLTPWYTVGLPLDHLGPCRPTT